MTAGSSFDDAQFFRVQNESLKIHQRKRKVRGNHLHQQKESEVMMQYDILFVSRKNNKRSSGSGIDCRSWGRGVVSFAAVFRDVTQRSPSNREAPFPSA